MRALDAMIVWTPNRGEWKSLATVGQIAVTAIPEPDALRAHPMSAGACDQSWRTANDEGRVQLMQRYFTQMLHRDFLDERVVRATLSAIDEFRDHPFSAEKPDGDGWQ